MRKKYDSALTKMQSLSDEDLLKVFSLKDEYQPEAIIAAEKVLEERNIPINKTEKINTAITLENDKLLEKQAKKKEQINKFLNLSTIFAIGYAPDMEAKQIKRLKLFLYGLIGYYLLFLWYNVPAYYYFLKFFDMQSIGITIEMVSFGIVYPIGIYHFSKLRKKGWSIIFYLMSAKFLFYASAAIFSIKFIIEDLFKESQPSLLDDLIAQPNYFTSLFILFAFGSILWYLLKESVMKLYKLSKEDKRNNIIGAIIFTVIFYTVTFLGIIMEF